VRTARYFCPSFRLLHHNINIESYRTIILLVARGCETWCRSLNAVQRLRVFDSVVLRGVFGPGGEEKQQQFGENFVMRTFIIALIDKCY
jgi:hypothetical protein